MPAARHGLERRRAAHTGITGRRSPSGTPSRRATVRAFVIDGSDQGISAAACTAGAEIVAAVSGPPWRLTVWDGKTGERLAAYAVPPDIVRLTISPGGAILAAVDIAPGCPSHRSEERGRPADRLREGPVIRASRWSPSHPTAPGSRSPCRAARRRVIPRRSRSGTRRRGGCCRRSRAGARSRSPCCSRPTGDRCSISSRSSVRLWRLPGGDSEADRQPAGHKDEAWSVAFAPDGRVVATGSDDSEPDPTIKLWDPATGRLIRAWAGGEGTVSSLAFAPDGRVLASGHLASKGQRPDLGRGDGPAAGDPRGPHRPGPRRGLRPRRPAPGLRQLRRHRPALGRRHLARAPGPPRPRRHRPCRRVLARRPGARLGRQRGGYPPLGPPSGRRARPRPGSCTTGPT